VGHYCPRTQKELRNKLSYDRSLNVVVLKNSLGSVAVVSFPLSLRPWTVKTVDSSDPRLVVAKLDTTQQNSAS
jgi:hypothetical protein